MAADEAPETGECEICHASNGRRRRVGAVSPFYICATCLLEKAFEVEPTAAQISAWIAEGVQDAIDEARRRRGEVGDADV